MHCMAEYSITMSLSLLWMQLFEFRGSHKPLLQLFSIKTFIKQDREHRMKIGSGG